MEPRPISGVCQPGLELESHLNRMWSESERLSFAEVGSCSYRFESRTRQNVHCFKDFPTKCLHSYTRCDTCILPQDQEAHNMRSTLSILTTIVPLALAGVIRSPQGTPAQPFERFAPGDLDSVDLVSSPVAYASSPVATATATAEPEANGSFMTTSVLSSPTAHGGENALLRKEPRTSRIRRAVGQATNKPIATTTRFGDPNGVPPVYPPRTAVKAGPGPTRLSDQECRLLRGSYNKAIDENRRAEAEAARRRQVAGGCGDRL